MARPQRNNVDYFPYLCKEGKALFFIEGKYGNDGYATWVKTLRQLAVTNYHYLDLSDETELMFLSAKCKVSEEVLKNIITDLSKLGEFNRELWEENTIIYSEKFIKSIEDAYAKRNNNPLSLQDLLIRLDGLGVRKLVLPKVKGVKKPQSRVKESKEEKKEVVLPFNSGKFSERWELWKSYKNEQFGFKYKSVTTEQATLDKLANLSNKNEESAIGIISQSIENGWKGFFELTGKGNQENNGRSKGRRVAL